LDRIESILGTSRNGAPKMEARIRDSQNPGYWADVLDSIPAGFSIHSEDSRVLAVNKRLSQIYDRPSNEFLGRTCTDLFHQQLPECPHELILRSTTQSGFTVVLGTRSYQVTLSPVIDSTGTATGFTRMMTELTDQTAGKALLKLERAGTLEQMISGIAHDVGTPLGIISGYSEYLLMRSKAGEAGHKELSTILQQTRRIADSIKQMLDLVRPATGRVDAIALKGFLAELIELMGHHLRKAGVKAVVSCSSSPPLIYGDAPKLRRAFFNLVITAIGEVGQGGDLEFVLGDVPGRSDLVNVLLLATNDNGPAPDFEESFAAILGEGVENELLAPGLSLTREILEAFRAEIRTVQPQERRAGLSICIPVKSPSKAVVSAPY